MKAYDFQVTRLDGRGAISQLFSFDLEIASLKAGELSLDALLGNEASIGMKEQG